MGKKVVVVEDTKNIREIISFMLKSRGFEIIACADGIEAENVIKNENPDLVILDVMLPGKDGFEICLGLKSNPKTRHIPVIILTAITQGTDKPEAYYKDKIKADEFLSKPFKAKELIDTIDRVFAKTAPKPNQ